MLSSPSSTSSSVARWSIRKRLLYSFFGVLLLFCLVTLLFLAHNVIHPAHHQATMLPASIRTVTIDTASLDASQLSKTQIERICKSSTDAATAAPTIKGFRQSNSSNSATVASSIISTSIAIPFGTLYKHHTEVGYFPRADLLAVDSFSQGWNLSRALKSLPPASLPNAVATADPDSPEGELLRVRHRYTATVDTDLFLHIPSYDGLRPLHVAGSIGGAGQERMWRKANKQGAASRNRKNAAKAKESPKGRKRNRIAIPGTSSSSSSSPEVITSAVALKERLRGATSNRSSTTGCSSVGPVKCCLYDFRIFVFPLPSVFNVGLMPDFQRNVQDDAAFWTGTGHSYPNIWNPNSIQMQFVTEVVQGFGLQHHPCRTMDPLEATFIYMPVWGFYLDRFTDSGVNPKEDIIVRKQGLELISCYLRQKDGECVDRFWTFIDDRMKWDWEHRAQLEEIRTRYSDLSPFPVAPSLEYDINVWGLLSSYRTRFLRNELRDHLVPSSRPYGWRSHPWATWIEEPAPFIHLQYETYLISNEFDYMRAKNIQIPVVCPGEAMYTQYLLFNQWKWSQKKALIQTMQQMEGGEFETEEQVQAARAARKSSGDSDELDSNEPFELDPLLCGALDHLERLVEANPFPAACTTESTYSIPSPLANEDTTARPTTLSCPPSSAKITPEIVKRWRSKTSCSYGRMDITDPTAILHPQSPLFPLSSESETQFLQGVDVADRGYLELQAEWERLYVRDWLYHYRSDQSALREVIHLYNDGFQFPSNIAQSTDRFRDFEYLALQQFMPQIMPTSKNARRRLEAGMLDYFKPIPAASIAATNSSVNNGSASTPFRAVKSLLELPSPLSRPIFAFFFGSPEIYKARQTLHSVLVKEKDCVFVNATRRGKTALTDFSKFYLQSTFCFILAGDTPGSKRLYDSILSGCIPVFINDRWGPTFSFLPWHRFSVRYSEARLQSGIFQGSDLMRVLRSFSQLEILEMQRQLYFVRSFFMYPLDSYQHPVRALMKLQDSHPENVLIDRAREISSLSDKITMLANKGDQVAAENLKAVQARLKQEHAVQKSMHIRQRKQQAHLHQFNMPTSPSPNPQQPNAFAPGAHPPNQFGPPMPAGMKPNPFAPRFMQAFAHKSPFAGQAAPTEDGEEFIDDNSKEAPAGPLVETAAEMEPELKKAIRRKWGENHDFRPRAWDAFEGLMLEFERRVEYAEHNRFQAIPVFSA